MTRNEREQVVMLLYLLSMDGQFNENDYSKEMIDTANEVFSDMEMIDQIITQNLTNWTIDRLNYVDKAIIRYAVFQMKYNQLPFEVIINEAVEFTKIYSNLDDDLAKSFNNKLLDNIKKSLMK